MPNHVRNLVSFEAQTEERAREDMAFLFSPSGTVDFNNVIARPEILDKTSCPNRVNPEECVAQTGYSDWYSWSLGTWGTKWNAYDNIVPWPVRRYVRLYNSRGMNRSSAYKYRVDKKWFKRHVKKNGYPKEVGFDTAWCIPDGVYLALSMLFPDVIVKVRYADEDVGCNCGIIHIMDGNEIFSDVAPDYNIQSENDKVCWRHFANEIHEVRFK